MRPIATDGVGWSVSRSVYDDHNPCKNGWNDRHAIWDVDLGVPKELFIRWVQIPTGRGIFEGIASAFSRMPPCTPHATMHRSVPMVLTSGFPHMLSTIIPVGRLQKKLSVTLIFQMKNPPATWPLIKSIWPLVIIFINAKIIEIPSWKNVEGHRIIVTFPHTRSVSCQSPKGVLNRNVLGSCQNPRYNDDILIDASNAFQIQAAATGHHGASVKEQCVFPQ